MDSRALIRTVVDIVHLRQAGVTAPAIERHLADACFSEGMVRRILSHVDERLATIEHRMALRLALSAETLLQDCAEVAPRVPGRN
ncbi:MAG: hypothetical protein FJ033_02570 [Chloroflexi bacterium]|nr:hypothetical protein [Chloroflexota bacterium]